MIVEADVVEEDAEEDVGNADQVVVLARLAERVGIGLSDLDRVGLEAPRLELLVELAHVDQLEVELLCGPDLARLVFALDQDGGLADESPTLENREITYNNI